MKWLLRLGLSRGLLGGSTFFRYIGSAALFIRLLQKIAGTAPKTLYTHKLKRGDALVITDAEMQR